MVRLTVIGSADAFNSDGRGHSCYWLEVPGSAPLMVDFGGTALAAVKRLGREPDEIDAIIVTHLHADHFAGLPFLHVDLTFRARRTRPLVVVGPAGSRDRIGRLLDVAYGPSIVDRAAWLLDIRELHPGRSMDVCGVTVEAFAASHVDAPDQALCFRMTGSDGTVVAFSGDTEPCDGLVQAASEAHLLVAECTAVEPPAGRHCTWADWPELLRHLTAERVVLTHLGPGVRARVAAELASLRSGPRVELADDGLVVDVRPRRLER